MTQLSYSHFLQLLKIQESIKRRFYETERVRGNWAVTELKRQINALYYERSGLSHGTNKLAELVHKNTLTHDINSTIRDPCIFEFSDLKSHEVMDENHLESALLDKLEFFLLELGKGLCFEARQKRILS